MATAEFPTDDGMSYSPMSSDALRRAICRPAPRRFWPKCLLPEKQGSNYIYGFRIYPVAEDGGSVSSRESGSHQGYVIWRKWEDCLYFQEALEDEYSRMAREKRNRLVAGKGVKKNGIYIHRDHASSFESLPPGPHPLSVARDIHEHIPKLSKKGVIFRASQATIDQRYSELQAMIDALFEDDVPMLIKELRSTRIFTDFFGLWRGDRDLVRKAEKQPATPKRNSITSSMFSAYFSASSPSLSNSGSPKQQGSQAGSPRRRISSTSGTSTEFAPVPRIPVTQRQPLAHSPSRLHSSPAIHPITQSPARFNPHVAEGLVSEKPSLASLPEDCEAPPSSPASLDGLTAQLRPHIAAMANGAHRHATVFRPPIHQAESLYEVSDGKSDPFSPASPQSRLSWQTTSSSTSSSASAYLEELGLDYALPSPHPESQHRARASFCSMASVLAESPVDARSLRRRATLNQISSVPGLRRRVMSFPEDAVLADDEFWLDHEAAGDEGEDLLDAYFCDTELLPESPASDDHHPPRLCRANTVHPPSTRSDPETPPYDASYVPQVRASRHRQRPGTGTSTSTSTSTSRRRPSAPSVLSFSTTSSVDSNVLAIKATHEENTVMLRVPRALAFADIRRQIYDKLVHQESSPVSDSFAIAVLVQTSTTHAGETGSLSLSRSRSRSGSGSGSTAGCGSDGDGGDDGRSDEQSGERRSKTATLRFVSSQEQWDRAVSPHDAKVALRIIGSRA